MLKLMRVPGKKGDDGQTVALLATINDVAYNLEHLDGFSITANITDITPALKTFVAADVTLATDLITTVAHGFPTGLVVQVSNSGGALPVGLVALTNYFIIRVTADTYKFASSLANANAGTAVDITGAGTGTQTTTPTALSGTIKLQASNNAFLDNTVNNTNPAAVWVDIPSSSTVISATGNVLWNVSDVFYEAVRIAWAAVSGNATLVYYMISKGQG